MCAAHRLKRWLKNTSISAAYMGNRAQHVHRTAIFYGRKEHYSFNFLGALNRRTFMPCNNMLQDLLSFHDVDVPFKPRSSFSPSLASRRSYHQSSLLYLFLRTRALQLYLSKCTIVFTSCSYNNNILSTLNDSISRKSTKKKQHLNILKCFLR